MNVVIGVLVVLCELHVTRVVSLVVDAVVGLTLGRIAHVAVVVFVVAILHRIFCIWRYTPLAPESIVPLQPRRVQSNAPPPFWILWIVCQYCCLDRVLKRV